MNYEALVEKLMQYFSTPQFGEEVKQAKAEFFDQAGILDEASENFEMKMAQFVDWFLLDRPLRSLGQTPIAWCMAHPEVVGMDVDPQMLKGLSEGVHSIFEFVKVKGEDVYVKDLFAKTKYVIKKSPVTLGFNRDQYFEARLFPKDDTFEFSRAFCFHPPQVARIISGEIKKALKVPLDDRKSAQDQLLLRLFKLRYKHEQYKHLDVKEIYSPNSKLRV